MLTIEQIDRIILDSEKRKHEALVQYEKTNDKLCDFIVELEKTKAELEKVKVDSTKTEFGRAEKNGTYYYVSGAGEIREDTDWYVGDHNNYYNCGNYYLTEAEAEKSSKQITLFRLLDRFSRENGWTDEVWEDYRIAKSRIYKSGGSLQVASTGTFKSQGTVYFISREICEQAIEKYKDLLNEVL